MQFRQDIECGREKRPWSTMNTSLKNNMNLKLAVFLATSGHSGVDRMMGLLLPRIASRGIRVDLLHVRGKGPHLPSDIENLNIIELGTSHSFSSLIPVAKYLKRERPDALLSDKDRVNQVAIIAKLLAGSETRTVVRSGTTISKALEDRGIFEKIRHFLSMNYIYRLADAIITPSFGAAEDLSSFARIPLERITTIPNPVDRELLYQLSAEPPSHPWFNKGNIDMIPIIVGLGELGSSKDYTTLIKAFSTLRKNRTIKLVIIGAGRGKPDMEKLVSDLNIQEDVEFLGFVKNPFPYLGRADLFVLSSRYEGFGMALLEALSLGIPSVSTDCPSGPREILKDGRFGELVPVGDIEAMAQAMATTLDNPPEREFVMQAAIPYSIETVTDSYLQILDLSGDETKH